ncbi:uncharacterized protein BDR25DRAFT_267888 [Lindgomyces ingoldianus]|uniref:Uncharacterized protein n=1 Tax=Lindgomyces ingoldianus TaxID=673940 RepID=A0ACB6QJC6_9PLEO|nr:uncharacterized protein BDR25DRAFT_267888 [Lindgomyces ingoldianus]KAF2467064.1 hypothetical protein BDR25DRAFT_267888 [Lindgomyces ingoldianus]
MTLRAARLWPHHIFRGQFRQSGASLPPSPVLRSFFTSTQLSAGARLSRRPLARYTPFIPYGQQPLPFRVFRAFRALRFKSEKTLNPTPHLGSPEPAPSLSQRLRKLSREYGWSALGVYLVLGALDLPISFLLVRMLGAERIGHYEHVIVEAFRNLVRIPFPNFGKHSEDETAAVRQDGGEVVAGEGDLVYQTDGKDDRGEASIWTQLALAYAIHKSVFIFVRVPLTAAITPKVVKTLRKWGYDIGKRKPKPN